jgi:hypothetical protein
MHGDASILAAVNETPDVPVATRLGIYSDAYRIRLHDALASNFPRLQEFLGDEFSALALQYIDRHPSRFSSIRWYGEQLPAMLRTARAAHPWLAELASFEWAVGTAFDAANAAPLTLEALAALSPEQWPALRIEFHPSVQRLQLRTNAPQLFKALTDEQSPPEPGSSDTEHAWLVWRQELATRYRSLGENEAAAFDTMRGGGSFEDLCERLCEWHAEDEVPLHAATLLKQWLHEGCVSGRR